MNAAHLLVDLLKPFPVEQMEAWHVSKNVGKVRNNGPELVEQVNDMSNSAG